MSRSALAGKREVLKVLDFGIAKMTLEASTGKTTDGSGGPAHGQPPPLAWYDF